MTVTAPVTPGDLSSAAQQGREDGNVGEQAAGGDLSSLLADSCKEGREEEQKCANMVKTKGTIWL